MQMLANGDRVESRDQADKFSPNADMAEKTVSSEWGVGRLYALGRTLQAEAVIAPAL